MSFEGSLFFSWTIVTTMSTDYTTPLLISCCVYVLRLQGDRYYVGVTRHANQRFSEHWSGRGSPMTREFRPESVAAVHFPGDAETERRITLELIRRHGFDHADGSARVRGGPWAGIRAKGPGAEMLALKGSISAAALPGDASPTSGGARSDCPAKHDR